MIEGGLATDRGYGSAVLAGMPDPVIVIDGAGVVLHANPAAERVLGWRAQDQVGMSVMEVVHPDDRQLAALSLISVGSKETGTAIDVRVATLDGGWRHLEVIGTNLLADPAVRGIVLVARDLTERRRWEVAGGDEVRFRMVVQHSAALSMLVSREGAIASASGAVTRLLGHDPEHVAGRQVSELAAEPETIASAFTRAAASMEPTTVEASFVHAISAEEVAIELTIVNLLADPVVAGFIVTGHDTRGRKAAEAAVRESQRQLAEAQRVARLGSWEWNIISGQITWSPQLVDLFDLDEASYPRTYEAYLEALHPDDRARVDAIVREAFGRHQPFEVDHRVIARDGSIRWLHGRGTVVVESGIPIRMVGTCSDVSERVRLHQELQALALVDPLTGLHNRRGFLAAAEQQLRLARRLNLRAGLVYADLDNLKPINDTHGHPEGDRALQEVGSVIAGTFRESDIKARLGGDEFVVLLIDAEPGSAERGVERLRAALENLNRSKAHDYELAVSVGVVDTDGTTDIQAMLAKADAAMYADKQARRRSPRLLVVEDDQGLRRLLHAHLGDAFEITCAGSVAGALEAIAAQRPDIVLLDRNLPDSQGTQSLRRLRLAAGPARIVVMTGDGHEAEADTLRAGADDFLVKPFDLEVLDARLSRLV